MSARLSPTVKCQVCFIRYKSLAGHIKTHGRTAKVYKLEFDAAIVSPLTRQKLRFARLRVIQKKRGYIAPPKPSQHTGRKHRPETIEKIRQANLGRKLSEAHKLAISAGLLGHVVSDATKLKLSQVVITDAMRKRRSELQIAEKGSSWKGGVSRHVYFGKGKFRLKKIFGNPLKCFFPGCDVVEGVNAKSVDCHHLDGNHEHNPLDGTNWLPLCRRHHMIADGRLKGSTPEQAEDARKKSQAAHDKHMKHNYIGEIRFYHQ